MVRLIKHRKVNNTFTGDEPSWRVKIFASAFYTGYLPAGSGTLGSALGAAFCFIPGFISPLFFASTILLVFSLGVAASSIMEKRYGHDPSEVTIDEVVGMWISFFLLPHSFLILFASFIAFRFFDIVKPFPAKKFDTMHGGFGIMMDDVIAGIYANVSVHLILTIPWIKDFLEKT